jgi:hypothetical protein
MINELAKRYQQRAEVLFDPIIAIAYGPCPLCDDQIGPLPALSRRDNRTYICSRCGLIEALEGRKR